MNIPLTLGHYDGRSGAANGSEAVNVMVEMDEQGGKQMYHLLGTPGCVEFTDTKYTLEGRGGYTIPGKVLFVIGSRLYSAETGDSAVTWVGSLETSTGTVQWAEGPSEILIIDGVSGYVYTKSTETIAKITDPDFPTPKACAFKDGYGVVVEASSGRFSVSEINDFTSWDTLAFTTAEFEPDNLVSCLSDQNSLIAFGEKTIQTYYNSGNSTFPMENRSGSSIHVGCASVNCPARGNNVVFWLDNTGMVRKLEGFTQSIVSTRQIDYLIAQLSDISDSKGFVYAQEGHTFYVLDFPTDELTLVYDLSTQQWHKRTSYASHGIWRPAWIAHDGTTVYAGDRNNGKVYTLDTNAFTDNNEPSSWAFTLQTISQDENPIVHDALKLYIHSGSALSTGQGSDPQFWMQYSDDSGKTWSRERWRSMGKIGEYNTKINYNNLGRSRHRIYRFGGTDPVLRLAVSASLTGRALDY